MMKQLILSIFLLGLTQVSSGQGLKKDYSISSLPQERIYLHQNASLLLSGEHLNYQVYCFDASTELLSDFSKIAYVELIDSNLQLIFRHKIRLHKGMGQGDFFINSSIPSGKYKIISYTLAMKNGSLDNFFQEDMVLINPFQSDQSALLETSEAAKSSGLESLSQSELIHHSHEKANLELSDKVAKTRALVQLKLNIPRNLFGNYSISVRQLDQLNSPSSVHASHFKSTFKNQMIPIHNLNEEKLELPELRGELIQGKVKDKRSKLPQENIRVALSIPDENFVFKVATSNEKGEFFFNIDEAYTSNQALFEILDDPEEQLYFELMAPESIDYSQINFTNYSLNPSFADQLLNHSIGNQIQNSYAALHSDELVQYPKSKPFYYEPSRSFLLDDYTRFPTVKETILEVVNDVFTRSRKGKSSLHVRLFTTYTGIDLTTLLLVDGIMIEDHDLIINSAASKIKRINIVDEFYFYGNQVYKGIVAMESFDGKLVQSHPVYAPRFQQIAIPLQDKKYFQKDYGSSPNYDRIPDFRIQLLWQPNLSIESEETNLEFYTSDLKGKYQVIVEGFSFSGEGMTLSDSFEVR